MSTGSNKKLMHRFWDEVNKGNLDVWEEVCTPDYIYHSTGGDMTLQQSKNHASGLITAFPDLNATIESMVAEGDYIAARYTIWGTHRGSYRGIAPTGKQIILSGIEIDKIANGKFVETWGMSDTFGLMQQLGVISI